MDAETNKKCELCCDMRAVAKICCLREKFSTKTLEKIKSVYSDDCQCRTQVFTLHKKFLERRETMELCNSQSSGWPPTLPTEINVNIVRTFFEEGHSLTCWEMAAIMDSSKSIIENIMKKLGMCCAASTWVSHHLMKQQLQQRVDICTCLKNKYQDDPSFICNVVTCDEMWPYSLEDFVIVATKSMMLNLSAKCRSSFFRQMWNHLSACGPIVVKNKNKPSILSFIVIFWKLCSHTSLIKYQNWRRNSSFTMIICVHFTMIICVQIFDYVILLT